MWKLTKANAAEAGFTVEDAEACGWHFPDPGVRASTLEEIRRETSPQTLEMFDRSRRRGRLVRAEKYTPGQGMTRLARHSLEGVLEEIFQHERAVFEKARAR